MGLYIRMLLLVFKIIFLFHEGRDFICLVYHFISNAGHVLAQYIFVDYINELMNSS